MAITKGEMKDLENAVKTCLESDIGYSFYGKCNQNDVLQISRVLKENGWKPTAMQSPKKRQAKRVVKLLKEFGMPYKIFYNAEKPKQYAIVGTSNRENSEVELLFSVLFNIY